MIAISSRGKHITQQFFDVVRTTSERNEVVILGIDDTSLQALGAWPWNRSIFAEVTKKLDDYRAKAVVFDVLFLEGRDGDDAFREVLKNVKIPVVLASKIEDGKYLESFLVRQSSSTVVASALSNVNPDSDGKVRRYPVAKYMQGTCIRGLGEQAFRISTFKKESTCEVIGEATFRYPNKVTTYTIVDVFSGKISDKELKGKVIFIGSTSLDLEDHFVGITGEKIPGVEVHASILTSLLNQEGDRELGSGEIFIVIILLIGVVLSILYYVKTILGQITSAIGTALVVVVVSYVFFSNHIIMPLPWMILTVLSSGGFFTLVRFIKEKKRSEHIATLFSKYVHKDVLKELMKSPESINLTGEKRYLTVLFSDLRGFTTLSESLSPEELTTVLNGYFSAMTPAVLEEHGTIDKYIGDAIMAFWNAPLEVKNHERHAVISALRMQEDLKKFNKEHNTTLAVGVGIHAGNAVVGNVGSKERVNYTVLGDTVNLASRVEGLTKKYGVEVLVTEEVKDKVDDEGILFRKLDIITVKGKNLPTVLYEAMRMDTSRVSVIKAYDEAFLKYQNGEFEKAKELFKALADKGDIPGEKMYERIMNLGEVHNWDGVWHFDEK
jgi:adenylate cyclase